MADGDLDDYVGIDSDDEYEYEQPEEDRIAELEKKGSEEKVNYDMYTCTRLAPMVIKGIVNQYHNFYMKNIEKYLSCGVKLRINPDNIGEMDVFMYNFDKKSPLGISMIEKKVEELHFKIFFHEGYPFEPPLLWCMKPTLKSHGDLFGIFNGVPCLSLLVKHNEFMEKSKELNTCYNPVITYPDLILSVKTQIEANIEIDDPNGIESFESAKKGLKRIEIAHQTGKWNLKI